MHAYFGKPEFTQVLQAELVNPQCFLEQGLFLTPEKQNPAFWIDQWSDVQRVSFDSISQAAEILRKTGKSFGNLWFHHPINHVRRGALIQENFKKFPKFLPIKFPLEPLPAFGCFSLLDQHDLIFSIQPENPIPTGEYLFQEDKINPPNRAYLKLWEAFCTLGKKYPVPGETCMDLGACPGGWTWVLQSFGAEVIAVDKAPLEPKIAELPGVSLLQQSAFALDFKALPNNIQTIDWLVCDIACYPDKLLIQLKRWIESGKIKNIISTIKLQGEIDLDLLQEFKNIPGIYLRQLWHNKHELTLFWSAN